MTFVDQLADDLLVADAVEPVTLERTDTAAPTVVEHALRRAVNTSEADNSGGRYTVSDTVWHFPSAELAEAPRLGDRIVDAQATRWTVIEVASVTLGSRWRCRTRNLAIAIGLDQQVVIERASWKQASDGAPVAMWSVWRINVAARVEPLYAETDDQDARRQTRRRLQVYLADALPLDHNHRIVHGAIGYRIVRSERFDALGHLQTLTVEPIDATEA